MAAPKLRLYYWNGLRWDAILTEDNANAIVGLELTDSLGNTRQATITITNRVPDKQATGDVNQRTGPHTDKFTLFKPIVLVDQETHMIVFSGYVYEANQKYDYQYGDSIKITAFDALAELRDYPAKELGVNVLPQNKLGLLYSLADSKQKQIKYLIENTNGVSSKILGMTEIASGVSGTTVKKSRNQLSGDTIKANLILEYSQRSVLQTINEIAMDDPHDDSGKTIGYDYYADANFTYPKPDLSTTLTTQLLGATDATTVLVPDSTGFATNDAIVIDSEQMTITGIPNTTTLTVATRNATDATSNPAAVHQIGAVVIKAWILPNGGTHKQEFNYHKRGSRPLSANFDTN